MTRSRLFLSRLPFTLATLAGLAIAALVTNTTFQSITHHWLNRTGFAPNDLWYWRIERMFTSALVTSGGVVFWEALFFVAFAVGLAEWKTGWKRTAATFWDVHLLALILLSLIISLAIHQLRDFGLEAAGVVRLMPLPDFEKHWNTVGASADFDADPSLQNQHPAVTVSHLKVFLRSA